MCIRDSCYTTNGNDVSATCTGTGVTCINDLAAGQTVVQFPAQGTTLNLRHRACFDGGGAAFVATAQINTSYTFNAYARTMTINGTSEFVDAENSLRVGNAAGNALSADQFYVSWDATNIYVGYLGASLTSDSDRYFNFYINGATAGTLTVDDLPGAPVNDFGTAGGNWEPDFGAEWHFYFRTDTGSQGVRQFSGGAWGFPLVAPTYSQAQGGVIGGSTAFIEYSISRASLGLVGGNSTLRIQGAVFDIGGSADVRFPASASGAQNHLNADMGAANFPNFSGYVVP